MDIAAYRAETAQMRPSRVTTRRVIDYREGFADGFENATPSRSEDNNYFCGYLDGQYSRMLRVEVHDSFGRNLDPRR